MIVIYLSVKNGDGINISRRILERKYAISIDIKKVETLYLEKDNIKEEDRELSFGYSRSINLSNVFFIFLPSLYAGTIIDTFG